MATERMEVARCGVCGIVAEVLEGGAGELVCCGRPCERMTPRTADEGREKHLPVVTRVDGAVKVAVGGTPHPMEAKHYIQWIEVIADGRTLRQFLRPGAPPEATFRTDARRVTVRELCNVHGLWETRA